MSAKNDTTEGVTNFRQRWVKSCSHVEALILLDIWKISFCLINYPNQSMAKKKHASPSHDPRCPSPSMEWISRGHQSLPKHPGDKQLWKVIVVIVITQNLIGVPPFFPALNTSLLHMVYFFLLCSIFFLVERGKQFSKVEGPLNKFHVYESHQRYNAKPCPFAVKSNRDHM